MQHSIAKSEELYSNAHVQDADSTLQNRTIILSTHSCTPPEHISHSTDLTTEFHNQIGIRTQHKKKRNSSRANDPADNPRPARYELPPGNLIPVRASLERQAGAHSSCSSNAIYLEMLLQHTHILLPREPAVEVAVAAPPPPPLASPPIRQSSPLKSSNWVVRSVETKRHQKVWRESPNSSSAGSNRGWCGSEWEETDERERKQGRCRSGYGGEEDLRVVPMAARSVEREKEGEREGWQNH